MESMNAAHGLSARSQPLKQLSVLTVQSARRLEIAWTPLLHGSFQGRDYPNAGMLNFKDSPRLLEGDCPLAQDATLMPQAA
eukprot:CAMPEP_0117660292 /NCGR_PEP_ID=MMETSP0804-20121206/6892_1 /TAXON_ID=1074897 /ORGANISM="Tetraselmis astigmatica, Strain CCMP880" /LENGTH=80 /DNA_ID=CAMNT_0005467015 /DNA_START=80 /DNA_END=322 /DNA_ORIENTATION=-